MALPTGIAGAGGRVYADPKCVASIAVTHLTSVADGLLPEDEEVLTLCLWLLACAVLCGLSPGVG